MRAQVQPERGFRAGWRDREQSLGLLHQDDNAPAHTKAWNVLKLGEAAARYGIQRGDQPARSPDLNVLDLYLCLARRSAL